MKKTLFLFLALTLLLSGCAKETVPPSLPTDPHTAMVLQEDGRYSIYLSLSGKTVLIEQTYEAYIPYISDELIQKAEQNLTKAVAGKEDYSPIYLSKDREGYLCLTVEIIQKLTPPSGVEGGGCDVDHKHIFHNERISTQPIK